MWSLLICLVKSKYYFCETHQYEYFTISTVYIIRDKLYQFSFHKFETIDDIEIVFVTKIDIKQYLNIQQMQSRTKCSEIYIYKRNNLKKIINSCKEET